MNARSGSRFGLLAAAAGVALLAAGCGSGSRPAVPTIAPARIFRLAQFEPKGAIAPGRPVQLSFKILEPSGATLTRYRRGPGPHTGIHLIIVRDDLATIIHKHPKVASNGVLREMRDRDTTLPERQALSARIKDLSKARDSYLAARAPAAKPGFDTTVAGAIAAQTSRR